MNNTLNTMMDHTWDSFYSGQIRQTRFPAIVDVSPDSVYDIVYTGTPPNKQLLKLDHQNPDVGMIVRIAYPNAGSFAVILHEKEVLRKWQIRYGIQPGVKKRMIKMNKWSDELKNYEPISKTNCGENRFLGI